MAIVKLASQDRYVQVQLPMRSEQVTPKPFNLFYSIWSFFRSSTKRDALSSINMAEDIFSEFSHL
jgi:hypothetical protein